MRTSQTTSAHSSSTRSAASSSSMRSYAAVWSNREQCVEHHMYPRGRWRRALVAAFAIGVACSPEIDAYASGFYFTDRGVRPLGRGGAHVAGADDFGAIWYNPAGLADAGTSILADFSW